MSIKKNENYKILYYHLLIFKNFSLSEDPFLWGWQGSLIHLSLSALPGSWGKTGQRRRRTGWRSVCSRSLSGQCLKRRSCSRVRSSLCQGWQDRRGGSSVTEWWESLELQIWWRLVITGYWNDGRWRRVCETVRKLLGSPPPPLLTKRLGSDIIRNFKIPSLVHQINCMLTNPPLDSVVTVAKEKAFSPLHKPTGWSCLDEFIERFGRGWIRPQSHSGLGKIFQTCRFILGIGAWYCPYCLHIR